VGGNHASWFHQVSCLRERFRLIAVDARGFGNSQDSEGLGRTAFVSDLLLLFDVLQLDKANIVAQSMGGATAALFACEHPQRVQALVLADTLANLTLPASIRAPMQEVRARTATLSQLERVLGPTFAARDPAMSTLYLALASFNSVNVHTLAGTQTPCDLRRLAGCGVPILFIVGEEDVLCPPWAVKAVQAEVAGSEFAEIAGSGHSAYFENPGRFNALVTHWLDRHAGLR
jgi:pimeloyl-ACP methyl ester carboxylesterase